MSENKFINKAARWPTVLLCLLILGSTSAIFAYQAPVMTYSRQAETADRDDIAVIISYLETRISERKVLDKAAEKLHTLDQSKINLIYSLCGRLSRGGDTASSRIAFSLVSAMIVLS